MLLITERREVGTLFGHTIYAVAKSEIITLPNSTVQSNMTVSRDEYRFFDFLHYICIKCLMHILFRLETCSLLPEKLIGYVYVNGNYMLSFTL